MLKKFMPTTPNLSSCVAGCLLVASFGMSGCSQLSDEYGDETVQATAVGSVMGAGLGAIIGSQTGSAGAGLAIGAVAGGGAGAAIGTTLQERSDNLKTQDEMIERQQQRITANSRALEELKSGSDLKTSGYSSSRFGSTEDEALRERYARAHFRRGDDYRDTGGRAAAPFASPAISSSASPDGLTQSSRAALGTSDVTRESPSAVTPRQVVNSQPRAKTSPDGFVERPLTVESDSSRQEDVALESAPKAIEKSTHAGDVTGNEIAFNSAPNQPPTGAIVTGLQPRQETDDDCMLAEGELAAADKASASADKLFHQRKALRLCPTSARFHIAIADTYTSLNRKSDAEFEIREALKLDPQNEIALAKLNELR